MIKTLPYRPLRELARGGMGVVHLAVDQAGQQVALKTLFNADPEEVRRWQQELRAGQALSHPGIAKILEAGVNARGQPWLAMELVPGESLKQKLDRDGPLPPDEVARIGREITAALAHAHEHGIIHRDLKPANVILRPDGQPVVIDLGLVRILNTDLKASRSLSQTGEIMGTPAFMAPEQTRGDKRAIGPSTDVWGLGATLYQLVTGELPFRGNSGIEVLEGVLDRAPVPPRSVRPEIPEWLEAAILKCLEKEPEKRWQVAEDLAAALAEPALPPARRRPAARPAFLVALAVAVVAAVALLAFKPVRSLEEPLFGSPAEQARVLIPERMEERIYGWAAPPELARLLLDRAEAALKFEPDYVSALIVKAGALQDLGKMEESFVPLNRAIELAPTNRVARMVRLVATSHRVLAGVGADDPDLQWLVTANAASATDINEFWNSLMRSTAWVPPEVMDNLATTLMSRAKRRQYLDQRPADKLVRDVEGGVPLRSAKIYRAMHQFREALLTAAPASAGVTTAELEDYQQRARGVAPMSFDTLTPFPEWVKKLARSHGLSFHSDPD